ncbi:MAG: ATP-binding protein [Desulfuromonadales bacterium]
MTSDADQPSRAVRLLPAGIRQRLFLLISLILLPIMLLLGGAYKERYESRRTRTLQAELEVAQGVATTFAGLVDAIRNLSYTLGSAIYTFSPFSQEKATHLLSFNVIQHRAIRNLSWANAQGTIVASSDPDLAKIDISTRPLFRQLLAGRDWALGDLTMEGMLGHSPTFEIATAIRTGGTLRGLVVAEIDPTRLRMQERSAGGVTAIFDRSGAVVHLGSAQTDLTWAERVRWRQNNDPLLTAALATGEVKSGIVRPSFDSGDWFAALAPISNTNWLAGAAHPLEVALGPVRRKAIYDAVIAALIAAGAFLVAWLLARSIARPILRLENDANQMLALPAEWPEDDEAPEEVRRLRVSVTEMAAGLRRQAETLRAREAEFRGLSEALPQMVWASELDGRAYYLNNRWLDYTGQSFAEAKDLGWLQALHPEDASGAYERWLAAVATGAPYEIEYRIKGKDGRYRWFLSQGRPLYGASGRVERWMGTCTDVGVHKALADELIRAREAAEEASRAKSEFLANMSHEIRTPLTIFLTATEYLLQIDRDPHRRELLEMSEQAGEKLLALIDDILDFSKIEARRLNVSATPFALRQCVEEAVKMLSLPAGKKNLPLRLEVASDVPQTIEGDAERLGQVLLNLIDNAVKFTESGEIKVSVARTGNDLRFAVADTGIGLPEAKQHLLFRSFMQLDSSLTRRRGGTGLGLVICKGLVELMGGKIGLESREGKGSTFFFTLPLRENFAASAAACAESPEKKSR